MRSLHEALPLGDDAPTPDQLFALASRAMVLARRHNRIRPLPHGAPRSHSLILAKMIVPDLFEAPFGYKYEERLSVRVARTGFRSWSLRCYDTLNVSEMGSGRGGVRNQYSCDWTDRQATLAEHRVHIIPTPERDMLDDVEAFGADGNLPDEWYWRSQLQTMTAGDVQLLTQEFERRIV